MIKSSGNDEIVRPLFVVTSETDQRRICLFREEFERARVFERTHDVLFLEDQAVRRLKFGLKDACKTTGLFSATCLHKKRLRDSFFSSKSRQVTGQVFSGPNSRQESRTGFKIREQAI